MNKYTKSSFEQLFNQRIDALDKNGIAKENGIDVDSVEKFTDLYFKEYLVSKDTYGIEDQRKCTEFLEKYFKTGTTGDRISKSDLHFFYCKVQGEISNISFWKYIKSTLFKMNAVEKKNRRNAK